MNFLIVEDEAATSRALSATLAIQGLGRSDIASTADQARSAVRARAYEVIFLDINLPEPLGETLLKEFLVLRPTQAVVMVTGLNDAEVAVRCLRLGARDYLTKPCSPARLSAAVQRARQPVHNLLPPGNQLPSVDDVTDAVIHAALERTDGNLTHAAQMIGMSRSGLAKRMAKRQPVRSGDGRRPPTN
ncbi:MAG: response regulator [Planctomycetota bacterium]